MLRFLTTRGWDEYHLYRRLVLPDLRIEDRYRVFTEFGNSERTRLSLIRRACVCYPDVTGIASMGALSLALDACALLQDISNQSNLGLNEQVSTPHPHLAAMGVGGETVADIGNSCWYVFQGKNNNYWRGRQGHGGTSRPTFVAG